MREVYTGRMESPLPRAPSLLVPAGVRTAMAAAAAAAYPDEACGLLLGRLAGGAWRLEIFRPTANAAADPRRSFVVPPLELLSADSEARRRGYEIVGIWHSHPDAAAFPSRRDLAEAWEGYSYGIHAATREGTGELRFFQLDDGAFREIPWSPDDGAAGGSR